MKYTQVPENLFETIVLNAGIIVDEFTPDTQEIGDILMATSGGINFQAVPEFEDFGEDIDNCPKNTKELKRITGYTVTVGGNGVSVNPESAARQIGAADISGKKITPRTDLKAEDFKELWLICDYSDKNTGENAGFVAIHMLNTLSTGGFQIQTTDKGKAQFAFEYTAHYSIEDTSKVPFEVYVSAGA